MGNWTFVSYRQSNLKCFLFTASVREVTLPYQIHNGRKAEIRAIREALDWVEEK